MSSTIGTLFKVTTFGESHGEGVGCVIDGCPAGLLFDYDYIKSYLKRRRPSAFFSTGRIEEDSFKVLSGIFNGYTLGTPISVVIFNENQNSKDYEDTVSYTHLTLPTILRSCRSRWSPYH